MLLCWQRPGWLTRTCTQALPSVSFIPTIPISSCIFVIGLRSGPVVSLFDSELRLWLPVLAGATQHLRPPTLSLLWIIPRHRVPLSCTVQHRRLSRFILNKACVSEQYYPPFDTLSSAIQAITVYFNYLPIGFLHLSANSRR